jgi:hypothetical protein
LRAREAAQPARGVASIDPGGSNVFGDDRAGTDDHVIANRHWQNGGIGADTDMVADFGCTPQIAVPVRGTAGFEKVVDKHGTVRNDAIVAYGHEIAYEGMGLNFAAPADDGATLNFHKRANKSIITNHTPI